MFESRIFQSKYFLGWFPASLLLSLLIGSDKGFGFIVFYTFGLCFTGLVFLGLIHLIWKFKGGKPVQWEIIWWCYPPVSILVVFWAIFKVVLRIG